MKRIISVIAVCLMMVTSSFAQEQFRSHWFIQLQGGANHTIGEAKFQELLAPSAAISAGYHFSPVFGLRFGMNGGGAKGSVLDLSGLECMDFQTNYTFYHSTIGLDFMLDIVNIFANYKSTRIFNPYIFAGLGVDDAFFNYDALEYKELFAKDYLWEKHSLSPTAKAGLGVDVRLSDNLDLNLEANAAIFNDKFNSKAGSIVDIQLNALAGLTYKFCYAKIAPKVVEQAVKAAPKVVVEELVVEKPEQKVQESKQVVKNEAFKPYTDNIYFIIRQWDIRASELLKLEKLVALLKANPKTKLYIAGHADKTTGNSKLNQTISENRCEVILNYFLAEGISKDRIITQAYGDTANPYAEAEKNRLAICIVK